MELFGGAGHSKEIAKRISSKGMLIGIDRDQEALKAAQNNLKEFHNIKYVHDNHDNIKNILEKLNIEKVDGILLDLGVSSYQLVEIIEKSIPKSKQKEGHPAKRTFQAIRIEVNDEIKPLYNTVKDCIDSLRTGGRLCIITFHSLEDRAVKNAYIEAKGKCTCPKDLPYCVCGAKSLGKVVTKKPIVASEEEQLENSRSKSAKLRIFEKT